MQQHTGIIIPLVDGLEKSHEHEHPENVPGYNDSDPHAFILLRSLNGNRSLSYPQFPYQHSSRSARSIILYILCFLEQI